MKRLFFFFFFTNSLINDLMILVRFVRNDFL